MNWRYVVALGCAHAVGDAMSGYTVASLGAGQHWANIGAIVLAYNVVAFGLQPLAGLIIDRTQSTKKAVVMGMGAMGLGLCLFLVNPLVGIGCIALGSAFGFFFLQASTPIILTEVVKRLPRFSATAAGLVLGFAILVGGIPVKVFGQRGAWSIEVVTVAVIVMVFVFFGGSYHAMEERKVR